MLKVYIQETELYSGNRFPLKAAGVMHTVALRTEATITTSTEMPPNLGQAFKVKLQLDFLLSKLCYLIHTDNNDVYRTI